ncbi:MAG: hypothetical protein HY671_10620 [Chloroflexi bacterium]|nr:hypothetical protein [Chloroflexota bacterium]
MNNGYTIDWMAMPKSRLVQTIKMISANAVTLDGLWFRGIEDEFGLDAAVKLDRYMWERLAAIEARRIKENLDLDFTGLLGLARALMFDTMVLALPLPEVRVFGPSRMLLYYPQCGVHEKRDSKGLAHFPCKDVGIGIYKNFVRVLDPSVSVKCVCCPPDEHPGEYYCAWEFTVPSYRPVTNPGHGRKDKSWLVDLESLPAETLVKIIKMFATNCYSLDGLWFRGAEREYGMEAALRHDLEVWRKFAPIEAHRLQEYLDFQETGVAGVVRALNFETVSMSFPPFEVEESEAGRLLVSYPHCLPQEARVKQGVGEFHCKEVGVTSWEGFVTVLDPTVKIRCHFAPLDPHPAGCWCRWEFYQ